MINCTLILYEIGPLFYFKNHLDASGQPQHAPGKQKRADYGRITQAGR